MNGQQENIVSIEGTGKCGRSPVGIEGVSEEHRKVPHLCEGESWLAFQHLSHRGHQWPDKMASAK